MAKVIKNSAGKVLVSSDTAFKVDATIDSNIIAGNIKKDVEILGVVGTYEGSGDGASGPELTFYPCSSNSGTRGSGSGGGQSPEPGTNVTFYASYPSLGKAPVALLIYDSTNAFTLDGSYNTSGGYALLSVGASVQDGGGVGAVSVVALTETLATLHFSSGYPVSFNPTILSVAPIYAINNS